jgi:hypothetical protein
MASPAVSLTCTCHFHGIRFYVVGVQVKTIFSFKASLQQPVLVKFHKIGFEEICSFTNIEVLLLAATNDEP